MCRKAPRSRLRFGRRSVLLAPRGALPHRLSRTALTTERASSTSATPRTDYIGSIGLRSGIDETIGACSDLVPNRVVRSGCKCLLKRLYNLDGSVHLAG